MYAIDIEKFRKPRGGYRFETSSGTARAPDGRRVGDAYVQARRRIRRPIRRVLDVYYSITIIIVVLC